MKPAKASEFEKKKNKKKHYQWSLRPIIKGNLELADFTHFSITTQLSGCFLQSFKESKVKLTQDSDFHLSELEIQCQTEKANPAADESS